MSNKKWIVIWFSTFSIIPFIVLINYYIDPFWTFSHKHQYNSYQKPFNERQQKTNYIYFNSLDKFDGILLGSSRTTYINQNDFGDMNIYNYSFNSGHPYEFKGYIDFAKEVKGSDLKYIIIGADFIGTKIPSVVKTKDPSFYTEQTKSIGYKYKTLLSFDTFKESIKNIKISKKKKSRRWYDRNNIKYRESISDKRRLSSFTSNLNGRINFFKSDKYIYDEEYYKKMKEIKDNNPNTEFIIFTSPVSAALIETITKNRLDDYKRWLKELVDIYGKVYHFMTINTITKNKLNYPDAEHYYDFVGKLLSNKISQQKNNKIPKDFGIILDNNNISSFLNSL